jgi:hypothetical protein
MSVAGRKSIWSGMKEMGRNGGFGRVDKVWWRERVLNERKRPTVSPRENQRAAALALGKMQKFLLRVWP